VEEINRQIDRLSDKVHQLDVEQKVLNANLLTLTASVAGLTTSVANLSVLINQMQGAMNFAKYLWGSLGLVGGAAIMYLKSMH